MSRKCRTEHGTIDLGKHVVSKLGPGGKAHGISKLESQNLPFSRSVTELGSMVMLYELV